MAQSRSGFFETESILRLGWVALALAFVTGVLHIYSGFVEGRLPVLLAGVGFFGAMGLYLANYRRRLLYLVGIVYTAVQIPIWYVVKAGEYTAVGYVDKVVQGGLIVVLAYLYWAGRSGAGEQSEASPAD